MKKIKDWLFILVLWSCSLPGSFTKDKL